ncbi:MAG: site-specific DNA-methyltransferase [Methanomicrobiales archaeon HGW-Methanomicrobiales-6]|nr:MAG: site-specific DNA-methyltransferase [Methanomicrobiales archaeon HGW-Methanomicrobiales-6]
MSEKYKKLVGLLKELFQLDQPDLDFGLYRIMHARSREVTQFLDKDLLPQVREAFEQYQPADKASLQAELASAIKKAQELGADPETIPKITGLRTKLDNVAVDIDALESEVYDHLYSFFRRYYSEGDFLAKRVYKPGVYAIPYEGEEVKLHWANNDQYYIKTSEYLRDYSFRLRQDSGGEPMRVHFRLADATEGEHGNVKPAEGKDRVFILSPGGESGQDFIAVENDDLVIQFEYRPTEKSDWPEDDRKNKKKPPTQKGLIAMAVRDVLSVADPALAPWLRELGKPHLKSNGETADYCCLEAHLYRYSARNTFDYFIHKDLGKFLRRELDFYIKNEVMHLDDVENETALRVEQYLSKIKVIRSIAGKIINFLAQLEDFQKILWLKKKFVIETNYCITIDQIPEEFYPEIVAKDEQRKEWVRLFAIDEVENYSEPLTPEFLKANDKLVLDTSFFGSGFTARLASKIDTLEDKINGMLIHGDNFQALKLLEKRYHGKVKCIYIDPPYNTDSSKIPYKNNYRHSSWIAMMYDRLAALHPTLTLDGAIFVSIDKTERTVLEHTMDEIFGQNNRVEELIWAMNTNNSQAPNYSTNHEYVLVYAKDRRIAEQDRDMFREPKPGFEEVMALVSRLNPSYPPVSTIEAELRSLYEIHKIEFREEIEAKGLEWDDEKGNDPWKGLYNYNRAEYRDENGVFVPEAEAQDREAHIWVWREDNVAMPATKQAASTRDPNHRNWRFYKPLHPVTGKPCPHPKSGWKYAYDDDEDSPGKRSFVSLDRDNRIVWGEDESKIPQIKRILHEVETNVGKSVFTDYSDGEKQTSAMFGRSGVFLSPKHADFVSRFVVHAAKEDSIILDCFGGTGSTAHAVIKLNRDDHGDRKYVLIEVTEYFDTVMKPRVLKAVYSRDWREGKPVSRDGISHCIKIIHLESYEDTLNNLEIRHTEQQTLLDFTEAQGADGFKEEYFLRYMLDVETRDSQSLLNTHAFIDPMAYKLRVKRPGSDESREMNIDLLETFNYLIGLTEQHIAAPQTFSAEFERDSENRLRLKDALKQDEAGPWWFRTVTGVMPDGRTALVIWRKRPGGETTEGIEQDNLILNEWFSTHVRPSRESTFDLIYVNGDNNLENLKTQEDLWKVRLIEEDFHRSMFDTREL